MFDTNPKVEESCTQVYEANHPGLLNDSDGVDECFVAMPEVRPFPSALYFCSEVQALPPSDGIPYRFVYGSGTLHELGFGLSPNNWNIFLDSIYRVASEG